MKTDNLFIKFLKWLGTFWDNSSNGGSIRKAIAVWFMFLIATINYKYLDYTVKNNGDFEFAKTLVYIYCIMIASLLGMIVLQKLVDLFINLKLGGKPEEPKPAQGGYQPTTDTLDNNNPPNESGVPNK